MHIKKRFLTGLLLGAFSLSSVLTAKAPPYQGDEEVEQEAPMPAMNNAAVFAIGATPAGRAFLKLFFRDNEQGEHNAAARITMWLSLLGPDLAAPILTLGANTMPPHQAAEAELRAWLASGGALPLGPLLERLQTALNQYNVALATLEGHINDPAQIVNPGDLLPRIMSLVAVQNFLTTLRDVTHARSLAANIVKTLVRTGNLMTHLPQGGEAYDADQLGRIQIEATLPLLRGHHDAALNWLGELNAPRPARAPLMELTGPFRNLIPLAINKIRARLIALQCLQDRLRNNLITQRLNASFASPATLARRHRPDESNPCPFKSSLSHDADDRGK